MSMCGWMYIMHKREGDYMGDGAYFVMPDVLGICFYLVCGCTHHVYLTKGQGDR